MVLGSGAAALDRFRGTSALKPAQEALGTGGLQGVPAIAKAYLFGRPDSRVSGFRR